MSVWQSVAVVLGIPLVSVVMLTLLFRDRGEDTQRAVSLLGLLLALILAWIVLRHPPQ